MNYTIRSSAGKKPGGFWMPTVPPDYLEKLRKELDVIKDSEMWRAGAAVRALRPENR